MSRMTSVLAFVALALVSSTEHLSAAEGTVILHGGGVVSSQLRDQFLKLAGGKNANLLIIPTADPVEPGSDDRLQTWRSRQPASVALLHAATRQQASLESFAEPLRRATGVWISGGRQTTLAAIYLGTPVERELLALLARGGVVAGTSAGAAIQSRVMLVRDQVHTGFDLVPHAVIDQHFLARNRAGRLWHVLAAHPQRFGIGIDEDTAAIIHAGQLKVMGDSTVSICINANKTQPRRTLSIKPGETFDLQLLRSDVALRTMEVAAPAR